MNTQYFPDSAVDGGFTSRDATLVILDEIHHFNKTQQDVLLPSVEKGEIILIGIALLALIVWESPLHSQLENIAGIICTVTLTYALAILWDTAKAVFIILNFSKK